MVKDDDDSDDDAPNPNLDLSFTQDMMFNDSGDIMKDIKKKIDEKLGNYNFADRPLKERKLKDKMLRQKLQARGARRDQGCRITDKRQMQRDKVKAMMRRDHQSTFGGDSAGERRPKKPTIVRRNPAQPPPINFNDLLKIAETKCKEKAPEPVIKIPKKVEERPLTQEELDRKRRAEDHKRRRQEEEEAEKRRPSPDIAKPKTKESSILKGALTGPSGKSSPSFNSSSHKSSPAQKASKTQVLKPDIITNKPSTSTSKPAVKTETLNPWDRIYGQIKKNNPPKPGG